MPKGRIPLGDYVPQRIALIKPSALGDIVHSLPVLTALRQRYPDAHISWVVNRSYEPLLRHHPDLNATLPFDRGISRSSWWQAAKAYAGFAQMFCRQGFDLVIDLQGLLRSGLITAASGAARRVGLSTAREGAVWFYTDVVPVADFHAIHAVDRYWLVAQALGADVGPKIFRVPVADSERRWARDCLQMYSRPWVMLGVGSRWITKRWLPEHFAVLAKRAQARFGGTVIFIGGREEVPLAQVTASQLVGPFLDLTGQTSVTQLAGVLSLADVMVANDTGPLHLAAALGRPVVAPFTCTKVLMNGPYGAFSHTVESSVWCQGSYLKHCGRLECMQELTPDRLWPILQEILSQWESRCRSA